eukprot:5811183-Prymnesium_polylepis.2
MAVGTLVVQTGAAKFAALSERRAVFEAKSDGADDSTHSVPCRFASSCPAKAPACVCPLLGAGPIVPPLATVVRRPELRS